MRQQNSTRVPKNSRGKSIENIGGGLVFAASDSTAWEELFERGRWDPVFQPIVSLEDGRVFAYEALNRPRDPRGTPVSIGDVVERAQEAGVEARVDAVTIRAAMTRAPRLPNGTLLFVNASPITLLDHPDVLAPLMGLRGRLVVEMTERAKIPDPRVPEVVERIARLRAEGIRVAMDDCGAGYSGLNRLVAFRPDFAKVDMELVRGVDRDVSKAALVEAFVRFARQAGIRVIAEGVEREAERDALAELGVQLIQGYLVGRPAPHFLRAVPPTAAVSRAPRRPPVEPEAALAATVHLANLVAQGLGERTALYEAVVQAARFATGADVVVLRKRSRGVLRAVARDGIAVRVADVPFEAFGETAAVAAVAARERRCAVRQTRAEGPSGAHFGSAAAAPIWIAGRIWGVLTIGYLEEHRVRADLVQRISGLADQVALIVRASSPSRSQAKARWWRPRRGTATGSVRWSEACRRGLKDIATAAGVLEVWVVVVDGDRLRTVRRDGTTTDTAAAPWLQADTVEGASCLGMALREGRAAVGAAGPANALAATLGDPGVRADTVAATTWAAVPIPSQGGPRAVLVAVDEAASFARERIAYFEGAAQILGHLLALCGEVPHESRPNL